MLKRAARELRTDDAGMTVAEIVITALILFFVLTAVLGLVGATTQSSISAKQRTAMTNAVSSYAEYVRALEWGAVALSSETPSGGVDPIVVKTDGAFTITLTNTLANGLHGTRELSISAVCSAPNFPTMHTTAFVALRDHESDSNSLGQPYGGGPIIDFGILTPAENTIVYESGIHNGGALYVDASAQSTSGVIYTMEFRVGDQRLKNGATPSADEAYWAPGTASTYQSIRWHTQQVKGDPSVAAVMDGWRIVRVLATDDLGRQTFKDRRFMVDNFAPSIPGTLTCAPRTDVTTLITWPKSMDGTDPAYRYEMRIWKQLPDSSWIYLRKDTLTQPAHTDPTLAFCRYWVSVRAMSPRMAEITASVYRDCLYPFISKPLLSGTSTCTITGEHSSRQSTVVVNLNYSQPTFPTTAIRYDMYRGTSPTNLTLFASSITPPNFSDTIVENLGSNGNPTPYYYQLHVTLTPTGWPAYGSSPSETIVSDIAGPTMITPGSGTMAQSW